MGRGKAHVFVGNTVDMLETLEKVSLKSKSCNCANKGYKCKIKILQVQRMGARINTSLNGKQHKSQLFTITKRSFFAEPVMAFDPNGQ